MTACVAAPVDESFMGSLNTSRLFFRRSVRVSELLRCLSGYGY